MLPNPLSQPDGKKLHCAFLAADLGSTARKLDFNVQNEGQLL
jgi:hypothetical protein